MIDPGWLKSLGFIFTIVGLIGNILILFFPQRLAKLEKTLRIAFILLMMSGVVGGRYADHIIATVNGPRHMSPAEWSALSDDMRAFAGEEFTIVNYTDETEATSLTVAIKGALDKAGWKYSPPTFGEQLLNGALLGVLIRINNASNKSTKDAAKELETHLNAKWITSRVWPVPDVQKNKIAIHIFTRPRLY